MNLLLLLSALLSALTGGASAVRPASAAHAVASAVTAVQAQVRTARIATRPQQAVAPLAVSARTVAIVAALSLVPATPLYASRRRE